MTAFTIGSKTLLARLMSSENIIVEHKNVPLASFDVKARVLTLPTWKDMTSEMYDLLTGHESGHALYTPPKGWEEAVLTGKTSSYKHFLNVVEDARIEKKVQRKYPGLRKSFKEAYRELLVEKDFFEIKRKNINTLPFIDRLNIYTKSQYSLEIKFNEEEQKIVDLVKNIETWQEVLDITSTTFEYSKKEQASIRQNGFDFGSFRLGVGDITIEDFVNDFGLGKTNNKPELEDEDVKSDVDDSENDNREIGRSNSYLPKINQPQDEMDDILDPLDENDKEPIDTSKETTDENDYDNHMDDDDDLIDPICFTDENFKKNEFSLLDEKPKEYIYLDIPTANTSVIVTPHKKVQGQLSEYYDDKIATNIIKKDRVASIIDSFKKKNERYIGVLVKEFEMRKSANRFSKSKICETGDIDINKLSNYTFDENIFRRITKIPDGKSHGLILLLDCSSSMMPNMYGAIEQILVLSMFCRKVGIPFIVYGFNDDSRVFKLDKPKDVGSTSSYFSENKGELQLPRVNLREYLSSKTSNSVFNRHVRNLLLLMSSYAQYSSIGRPDSERMSGTPLTEAIIGLAPIMKEFKQNNSLDMTSLVIVHDGDADNLECYYDKSKDRAPRVAAFSLIKSNVVLQDKKIKFQEHLSENNNKRASRTLMESALHWFKCVTKSNIIGFYIVESRRSNIYTAICNRYVCEDGIPIERKRWDRSLNNQAACTGIIDNLISTIKSEKYITSNNDGYDKFFIALGGNQLVTSDNDIVVDGSFTVTKLKHAFNNMNKRRVVSRTFVMKFIESLSN